MPIDNESNLTVPVHCMADVWTEKVLHTAEQFLLSNAQSPAQSHLLQTAFVGLRLQVENWLPEAEKGRPVLIPFVHLPIFVYAGVCGRVEEKAVQLSAATSLLFLGIDIFDDVADGDCPLHWGPHNTGERNLAAATLLSSLPQLLLAQIDAPATTIRQMQQTLASGLLTMSAGQQADLLSGTNEALKTKNVIDTIAAKSGAEVALFARMAAQMAQASDAQQNAYAKLGHAIGTAGQLSSDCYELFTDPACRDLLHGTRTLPIVLYLNSLNGLQRSDFLLLLNKARKDELAREEVKSRIRASGALGACAMVVENCCHEARKALKQANPLDLAREGLEAMIADVSFYRTETGIVNH